MRFGNREQNGVALRLRAALENTHGPAGVERGFGDQFQEHRFAEVVRTRACDQDSARCQQAQGAQIDLPIAARRRFQVAAGLDESRRVQHYEGVLAARGAGPEQSWFDGAVCGSGWVPGGIEGMGKLS